MTLQTLLILSATLLLCSGARLPRQLSLEDKMERLPDLDTCGLTDADPTREMGGRHAQLKEIPWMAAIGRVTNNNPHRHVHWKCGGSLITNQHVLTAAYCVHPDEILNSKRTIIRLGELDLNETINDGSQPQDFAVDSVIVHEQYNIREKTNIIAIIKMKTKVTFSSFIRPICLPPQEFLTQNFTGYQPSFAGWGQNKYNEPVDTHLTIGSVRIQDIDECRRNLTSLDDKVIIDSRVICATSPEVDVCDGYGGGPLVLPRPRIQEESPKLNYFLMGIISHGYFCGVKRYPDVYTNVASYSNWIIDHLDI